MTNPREPHDPHAFESEAAPLVADLTVLYRVSVPDLRLDLREPASAPLPAATGAASGGRRFVLRHWRPLATVAATAAALVLFAANPAGWGGTKGVSAQSILDKTNAVAATNAPAGRAQRYHFVATTEMQSLVCTVSVAEGNPASGIVPSDGTNAHVDKRDAQIAGDDATCTGVGELTSTTTETWFADAAHFRSTETFATSPVGTLSTFGHAVDGDNAWSFMSDAQGSRAVHGSVANLGMTSDLGYPNGTSLAEVLGQYNMHGCQSAAETGLATVAGRSAYVIEVIETPASCDLGHGAPDGEAAPPKTLSSGNLGVRLTLWVDRETYLPLRTETRGSDGGLIFGYAVTEIQVGGDMPALAFSYQPPAGTVVTEATSPADAKDSLFDGISFSGGNDVQPLTGPVAGASNEPPDAPKAP